MVCCVMRQWIAAFSTIACAASAAFATFWTSPVPYSFFILRRFRGHGLCRRSWTYCRRSSIFRIDLNWCLWRTAVCRRSLIVERLIVYQFSTTNRAVTFIRSSTAFTILGAFKVKLITAASSRGRSYKGWILCCSIHIRGYSSGLGGRVFFFIVTGHDRYEASKQSDDQ